MCSGTTGVSAVLTDALELAPNKPFPPRSSWNLLIGVDPFTQKEAHKTPKALEILRKRMGKEEGCGGGGAPRGHHGAAGGAGRRS